MAIKKQKLGKSISEIIDEISEILEAGNLILEEEENWQQLWQLGKDMKNLLEKFDQNLIQNGSKRALQALTDIYFIWGTVLARLASKDREISLAKAAVEKFEKIEAFTSITEVGAAGICLWASCKLMVACEENEMKMAQNAMELYETAVNASEDEKFEIEFQYVCAMKDTSAAFSAKNMHPAMAKEWIKKAIERCGALVNTEIVHKEEDGVDADDVVDVLKVHTECLKVRLGMNHECARSTCKDAMCLLDAMEKMENAAFDEFAIEFNELLAELVKFEKKEMKHMVLAVYTMLCSMLKEHNIDEHNLQRQEYLDALDKSGDDMVPTILQAVAVNRMIQIQLKCLEESDSNKESCEKLLKTANYFDSNLGCYQLVQFYAKFGNEKSKQQNCLHWLQLGLDYGVLDSHTADDMAKDPHLSSIIEKPWFIKFLAEPSE